ncbi:mortality factor 4-like protein 1 [Phtheirospermum japonicum]|uniref:Mortality factor 4-like protein 1 n=1 Tax=Phtheirospermum japonicum TaxID=374723 RepID=A0A830AXZ3_9LAMI|nr:mortality factor 4-like protein 1 [Phtheirospermum japonicum]
MVSSSREESASDGENSFGDAPDFDTKKMFSEGEKVLAYHGPRIYEAKHALIFCFVLKDGGYFGDHAESLTKALNILPISWDEWVGMYRLMKNTEENILKQQALDKKAGVNKNTKSGCSAQTKPKSSADAKVDKEEAQNVGLNFLLKGARRGYWRRQRLIHVRRSELHQGAASHEA